MIKRIVQVSVLKIPPGEEAEQKLTLINQQSDADLDSAIHDGYGILAHYPVDTPRFTGQIFVLFKPRTSAKSKRYTPHPDSPHR
jgi:hypothetical protein